MNRAFLTVCALFAALSILAPFAARAGDSMYVRAADTTLKSTAGPGGADVVKLDIGTKVEILDKQGPWAHIKVTVNKQDQTGFVFGPKLSSDKPDREHFGDGKVASASEEDTNQALRGLSPTAESFAGRANISPKNIADVKKMEDVKVPKQEVDAFLKDGKLAEYSSGT